MKYLLFSVVIYVDGLLFFLFIPIDLITGSVEVMTQQVNLVAIHPLILGYGTLRQKVITLN